jgi:hypothetical protein
VATSVRLFFKSLPSRLGMSRADAKATEVPLQTRADVIRWSQWGSYGERLRLLVPTEKAVMQGGASFADPSHHFRLALDHGHYALEEFYRHMQPSSLVDWHSVETERQEDRAVPAWEVPWIQRIDRLAPPGEAGLDASHGVSFYGPVSPQKVTLEYERLSGLRRRIVSDGYRPDLFGDVDGYFMLDDGNDFRFFVRGGKHRAAVLASLERKYMPVAFKQDWPRLVRLADSSSWPLVADGTLSENSARAVFLSYFNKAKE